MDNSKAKSFVDKVFSRLETAKSRGEIAKIFTDHPILNKYSMSVKKYPKISFNLNEKDIHQLKDTGMLDESNRLTHELGDKELSPLEKLLYSILWKNGDLQKEKHIVEGILSSQSDIEPRKGLVFYQFGRSLKDSNEPIIDQHVLRAFAFRQCSHNDHDTFNRWRSLSVLAKKDVPLINTYRNWILSDKITKELKTDNEYARQIDGLLFALGKSIKQR